MKFSYNVIRVFDLLIYNILVVQKALNLYLEQFIKSNKAEINTIMKLVKKMISSPVIRINLSINSRMIEHNQNIEWSKETRLRDNPGEKIPTFLDPVKIIQSISP